MKLVEKWNWKTVWSSIYEISYIPLIFSNNLVANSAIIVDLCWKDTKAELDWRICPPFSSGKFIRSKFHIFIAHWRHFCQMTSNEVQVGIPLWPWKSAKKKLFFKIFSLRLPQKLTCQVLHVPLNAQIMWFSNCRH